MELFIDAPAHTARKCLEKLQVSNMMQCLKLASQLPQLRESKTSSYLEFTNNVGAPFTNSDVFFSNFSWRQLKPLRMILTSLVDDRNILLNFPSGFCDTFKPPQNGLVNQSNIFYVLFLE